MPTISAKSTQPIQVTATILNGNSTSDTQNIKGYTLVALLIPAAWTSATITFQVSYDGVTFYNLYQADGTEYTLTVAASQAIVLPPSDFVSIDYIIIRSGTSGSPVTQGADRALTLIAANV